MKINAELKKNKDYIYLEMDDKTSNKELAKFGIRKKGKYLYFDENGNEDMYIKISNELEIKTKSITSNGKEWILEKPELIIKKE